MFDDFDVPGLEGTYLSDNYKWHRPMCINNLTFQEVPIIKEVSLDGVKFKFYFEVRQFTDGHDYMYNHSHNGFVCLHYIECRKCKKDSSCRNK